MSNYNRKTRECSVSQMQPELRQAIQNYFQEHGLGDPETESLMCCETISEKKDVGKLANLLGGEADTTVHMGVLFTSEMLIWARKGNKSDMVLNAANLKEIQVRAYDAMLTKETGLEIHGKIGNSKGRVGGFICMGPESAAQNFIETIVDKINEVNPPSKKKGIARWFSR